jgi:NADPH:quinone reductase-like Zn-dependent oxidoreductase
VKAIVHERYGPPGEVLTLRDIDMPGIADDEVLVRVRATSVNADVWHVVVGWPYVLRLMGNGVRKPKKRVPGTDLAGVVERVGRNVTRLTPGDEVFGGVEMMKGWQNGGTFAEYAAIHQDGLAIKPSGVTFEQAAAAYFSGFIALINLGPSPLTGHVLINGAGGGVGSAAVQIAKADGARVTGVDSAGKLEMIRALGADHAIDYVREDFTRGSERYDLILDGASTLSLDDCKRVLTPRGIYVFIGHTDYGKVGGRVLGTLPAILRLMLRSRSDDHLRTFGGFTMPGRPEILARLKTLLEGGALTPIVGRTFPLGETPAAIRCLLEGRTLGRIVVAP